MPDEIGIGEFLSNGLGIGGRDARSPKNPSSEVT